MMDFIKSWTVSVCLTLIISAVFSVISPKGSMGRFYKVIIAVFIFFSLLYPFSDFDFNEFKSDFNFKSELESTQESLASDQVENVIKNVLSAREIEGAEVECVVFQTSDEISIENVTVRIANTYDPDEVENIILEETGIAADVVVK